MYAPVVVRLSAPTVVSQIRGPTEELTEYDAVLKIDCHTVHVSGHLRETERPYMDVPRLVTVSNFPGSDGRLTLPRPS